MANRFLDAYDAFLLDIDGVIVRGSEPIPGAAATLEALRSQGHVILLTNNSTRTRAQHAERLGRAGLEVNPEMVLSSSYLAARHLHETYGLLTVFVVGEDGLREELRDAGHTVTAEPDAEAVVVGMDRDLTYAALRDGLTALEGGARLVATNDDATFPTPTGPLPGAGAIVGAFRGMGFEPEAVIGKPSSTARTASN